MKIECLDLARHLDALVTSEEVPLDKPDPRIFEAAFARLGVSASDCVVIGDRDDKDGEGARRLGMPYVLLDPKKDVEGEAFDRLGKELGL
jgi:HAD superfamily hydrolase (TIGR01509 family)